MGGTPTDSPNGLPGCCNNGDVVLEVDCTNTGDEGAEIFVRLDEAPAGECVDYSVDYVYGGT